MKVLESYRAKWEDLTHFYDHPEIPRTTNAAEAHPDGGDRLSEWLREIEERWTAIEGLTEGEHGSGTEGET